MATLIANPRTHRRPDLARGVKRPVEVDEDAVLQERARIARELHDGVAQTLYAIGLVAARAREHLESRQVGQLELLLDRVLELTDGGQREVRALLDGTWAQQRTGGDLTRTLVELATVYEASHTGEVRLALGAEPDLAPSTCEALGRIARQVLQNVAKHADARHVDLVLQAGATYVELSIADDGCGFDPALPRPGHFGLRSMRERAEAVGGTLEVVSRVGQGTLIRVRVPPDLT